MSRPEHPRYRFERWIAAGGMGEVWAGTDSVLDRQVALKLLKQEYADDDVFRARFEAEARHAASLQHPHVASVLDVGDLEVDGRAPLPFLVMELVDGKPLSAVLAEGSLAQDVAVDLVAQAADGLAAAHERGIVHRDVKPSNLLVTPAGQVKVTDFGVARAADAAQLTVTGHLVGTPHYLSPEQAEGKPATTASDVYALGIVLFECLAGRRPFEAESPVATALKQVQEPLPDLPPNVPGWLSDVVRRATAKDPAERFSHAGELATALRAEPAEPSTAVLSHAGPLAAVGAAGAGAGDGRRRLTRVAVLVAVVVLLAAAGAYALTATMDDEPTTSDDRVAVRAAAYVGLPQPTAEQKLEDQGMEPVVEERSNPGAEEAGTVAAVTPTGLLDPGTEVTLQVWTEPPAEPPSPTAEPEDEGDDEGPGKGKGQDKSEDKGSDKGASGSKGKGSGGED